MSDLKKNLSELFEGWNTIPNWLSFIRIALIPVFAILFIKDHKFIAVIIMILAELTDLFDGKIARKFNQVSNLGKILDPVADKLSQIAIVIILIASFWDSAIKYLFMFFIAKELVMIIGGAILISVGLKPTAAEIWGKIATNVFNFVMIFIMAFGQNGALCKVFNWTLPQTITWILVTISAVCTLISLLGYAPGFFKQLKEKKN